MSKLFRLMVALSILSATPAFAADIIEIAQYHGDELNAQSGQTWLGLFCTKAERWELKGTKLNIKLVNDPIIDESAEQKTGKEVKISHMGEPLVLIRGVAGLKPGPVEVCSTSKKEHLSITDKLKLKTGSNEVMLIVSGAKKEKEYFADFKVTLQSGGTKQQILHHKQVGIESAPSLLWAGDLDCDGKVDLIMDTTDHYNARVLTLFLSSKARAGELVKKVASHLSTGC